jgi:hypothetical protein
MRPFHEAFDHLDTGENRAATSPRHMRKEPMFNGVIFGQIGWVMRDPNFNPNFIRQALEVAFEEVLARIVAATTVT